MKSRVTTVAVTSRLPDGQAMGEMQNCWSQQPLEGHLRGSSVTGVEEEVEEEGGVSDRLTLRFARHYRELDLDCSQYSYQCLKKTPSYNAT